MIDARFYGLIELGLTSPQDLLFLVWDGSPAAEEQAHYHNGSRDLLLGWSRVIVQVATTEAGLRALRGERQALLAADRILAESSEVRRSDKVAALRFPDPRPCGKVPLTA